MAATIKGSDVATVYAEALFSLTQAAGTVDEVRVELQELNRLLEHEPGFAGLMTSLMVDEEKRERSLDHMFRGKLNDDLLKTLQVMNEHGRAGLLPQLLRAFVLRIQQSRGEIEATATSAIDLTPVEQADVKQLAGHLSGREPLIEFRVNPDIIGGLVLQIGGQRYDNSIRQQLEGAREKLLERSNRGLQIGSG